MNVLMISEDPSIDGVSSEARSRMRSYAELFDELHVLVIGAKLDKLEREGSLYIYPVTSRFRLWGVLSTVIHGSRIDCMSAQAPNEIGCIAWLFSKLHHIPLQVQVHVDIMSPWFRKNSLKEYIRYWCARFILPRANCIRVVSERIRNSLIRECGVFGDRISVLPIFFDPQKYRNVPCDTMLEARLAPYRFKLLAVGRFIDKEKNFSMLIRAMRTVTKVIPQSVLVIVGDGPDRARYEADIARWGLENSVILMPWQKGIATWYQSFDAVVHPAWYEGWGRVILEAIAAGVPVVMTDVGLAGEVLENGRNGIVIPVGDESALVRAIEQSYRDPETRRQMGQNAFRTASDIEVPWSVYADQYRRTFEQCGNHT